MIDYPPPAISQAGTTADASNSEPLRQLLKNITLQLINIPIACKVKPSGTDPELHKPIWGRTPPIPLNEPSASPTEKPAGAPASSPVEKSPLEKFYVRVINRQIEEGKREIEARRGKLHRIILESLLRQGS